MARRRRRVAWQGGPYTSPSRRLPLPQERVRRSIEPVVSLFPPDGRLTLRPSVEPVVAARVTSYGPLSRRPRSLESRFSGLSVLQIRAPSKALFCVRRKRRRESLFALKKIGFGGSSPKRHYRRTQESLWRC